MLDLHCHIDQFKNPHRTLSELERNKIYTISVTNLPSHFLDGYEFYKNKKFVAPALGFHPAMIKSDETDVIKELYLFKKLISKTNYVGEIGLDFSTNYKGSINTQRRVFKEVIKTASIYNKVVSVHSRNAESETIDILKKSSLEKVILHWYSGSIKMLKEAIRSGFFFSVNHKMINSSKGRRIIRDIPKNLILTETDAPFTIREKSPYPINKLSKIYGFLSQEWNISEKEVIEKIVQNFNSLKDKNTNKMVA